MATTNELAREILNALKEAKERKARAIAESMARHPAGKGKREHIPYSQGACPLWECQACEDEALAESMARHPAGKGRP